jgi:hypothetical protein
MTNKIQTYREFWPFYLGEHSDPWTRRIHVFGTVAGILFFWAAIVAGHIELAILGPVLGYALAWLSHALVEKNRPATFKYPLWSFVSDFRMLYLVLSGKL